MYEVINDLLLSNCLKVRQHSLSKIKKAICFALNGTNKIIIMYDIFQLMYISGNH